MEALTTHRPTTVSKSQILGKKTLEINFAHNNFLIIETEYKKAKNYPKQS